MQVWMVGAEMAPFSKVGGMGDVLGALPGAVAHQGCEVTVVIPYLLSMDRDRWGIRETGIEVRALVGGEERTAWILEARLAGVRVLLVSCPPFFHREGLYGTRAGDYPDNAQRFAFFSYAALEAARALGARIDVLHTHDWQTGLVPLMLRAPEHYGAEPLFAGTRSLHTIHNLSYQGLFGAEQLPSLGISWRHFHHRGLEFYGLINFLKAGLTYADALSTVSPTYALEIQSPDYAWGLHGVLVERSRDLHGILNGIDVEAWDPATDDQIPARYSAAEPTGKEQNRQALRRELGLPDDGRPLVGVVNRLVAQKGVDLIFGLDRELERGGLQWAILGSGEDRYEAAVRDLARAYPGAVAVHTGFDDGLARRIYAGSDLFCMPSYFEPCGLGQMIAMRYGSLPVARRTGGLADTVTDMGKRGGVGFLFDEPSVGGLEQALARAAEFFTHPRKVANARQRAMGLDFSWDASARRYLDLYRTLVHREVV